MVCLSFSNCSLNHSPMGRKSIVRINLPLSENTLAFPRLDAPARSTAVFHVPQAWGNVQLAAELFNLSVHGKTAHQWQIAVGFGTAFLHVE